MAFIHFIYFYLAQRDFCFGSHSGIRHRDSNRMANRPPRRSISPRAPRDFCDGTYGIFLAYLAGCILAAIAIYLAADTIIMSKGGEKTFSPRISLGQSGEWLIARASAYTDGMMREIWGLQTIAAFTRASSATLGVVADELMRLHARRSRRHHAHAIVIGGALTVTVPLASSNRVRMAFRRRSTVTGISIMPKLLFAYWH